MKGVLLPGNREVVVTSFPMPTPAVGEVVVRIKASAICRSDLSLYYGNAVLPGVTKPVISGHEPAGIIEEVGAGVVGFKPGDRVAIYLAVGCGHCSHCRRGDLQLCVDWECLGFTRDGGNAEFMVVPAANCLRLPDGMSFVAGAVSTDAFGTLYSACSKLQVAGDVAMAIFGIGPMGCAGILAAKALGARVIAVDPLETRRDFAIALGADTVLDPAKEDVVGSLIQATGGRGVDVAIDCSGNSKAQNAALDATRRFGKVAFIGESRETTINPSDQLIRKQLTLMGSWYFNISEWDAIARVIIEKSIPIETLVTHRFSLDEAPTAFRLFDERKTEKAVFVL